MEIHPARFACEFTQGIITPLANRHATPTKKAHGLGYGMMPERQVERELSKGRLQEDDSSPHLAGGSLIDLSPEYVIDVPLYWHHWRQGGKVLNALTDYLLQATHTWLVPLPT